MSDIEEVIGVEEFEYGEYTVCVGVKVLSCRAAQNVLNEPSDGERMCRMCVVLVFTESEYVSAFGSGQQYSGFGEYFERDGGEYVNAHGFLSPSMREVTLVNLEAEKDVSYWLHQQLLSVFGVREYEASVPLAESQVRVTLDSVLNELDVFYSKVEQTDSVSVEIGVEAEKVRVPPRNEDIGLEVSESVVE